MQEHPPVVCYFCGSGLYNFGEAKLCSLVMLRAGGMPVLLPAGVDDVVDGGRTFVGGCGGGEDGGCTAPLDCGGLSPPGGL